ncbi:three-Cys-motif partner protein TcmP [Clostridiaceae bacterium]|nr:three-Cys-motif partner protein TcmP [Clostridiaceae bacterium]RKI08261.1 three-Cys-motif partner protein TcmP [bacterium 1XD21-70]
MASSNNSKIVSKASPHTIMKFKLVEEYIKAWAQKLMLNSSCYGLVFIDCMCNSGVYTYNGETVEGTPIRVAKALLDVAHTYPQKQIQIYLNDNSQEKVDELKKHLPADEGNFKIIVAAKDRDELLEEIGPQLHGRQHLHYFLFYDPYDASINWPVLIPFLRNWGEVMINHMVSDTIRAITQVRREATKEKYANTYLTDFEKLIPFGSEKKAYEERVEKIIQVLKGQRRYFVGAFPFYNTQNSQLYSLIHCTSNIEGFKLYKQVAWKTFGGKSSTKDTHGDQLQLTFDFNNDGFFAPATDESCFFVTDIAKYLQRSFAGQSNVPLDSLWQLLDYHPIFPSEGFRKEIRAELKNTYGATFSQITNPVTCKKQTVASFLKGSMVYE